MGNQRRSQPEIRDAIGLLGSGEIGKVRFARCWYDSNRGTIGHGKPVPVPSWLNYDLWRDRFPTASMWTISSTTTGTGVGTRGGGELANNGIHALDIAPAGVGCPIPTARFGDRGRYHFDDDQENPDTTMAAFDLGSARVTWDASSRLSRKEENTLRCLLRGSRSPALDTGAWLPDFRPGGPRGEIRFRHPSATFPFPELHRIHSQRCAAELGNRRGPDQHPMVPHWKHRLPDAHRGRRGFHHRTDRQAVARYGAPVDACLPVRLGTQGLIHANFVSPPPHAAAGIVSPSASPPFRPDPVAHVDQQSPHLD